MPRIKLEDDKPLYEILELLFEQNEYKFNHTSILYRFLRLLVKRQSKMERLLQRQIDAMEYEIKILKNIDEAIERRKKDGENKGRRVTDYIGGKNGDNTKRRRKKMES